MTLGLVTLMAVVLALAIDDARWVLGRTEYLDMLVWTALGGVLVGFIGAKVGWGRWLTYLIGAIFAALIVPVLTGLVLHTRGAPIHELFIAAADSVVLAWIDLAIRNQSATTQYLHYTYTLGLLVWATSMFASYAVFGHHRPLNAVIVIGLILLGNMALTGNSQLVYLIVFSVASLFLLIRSHVFDEQSEWMRRRIGDPASISSVYLRGGTVFIAVAVIASTVLTQTAASAPLAGAWDGVEDGLLTLSRSVSRFLPTGGSSRPVGLTFGDNTQIGQVWQISTKVAMTITRDPKDKYPYYWRAVTYDQLDAKGWSISKTVTAERDPGAALFGGLADDVDAATRKSFTYTVAPAEFGQPTIIAPQTPVGIDIDTQAADHRFRSVRDPRAERRRVRPAVHGDGPGAGRRQRPGAAQRVGAPPDIDDIPRRHQGAVPRRPGGRARTGIPQAQGEDPLARVLRRPVRHRPRRGQGAPVEQLQVRGRHPRRPLRIAQHGRVLRHLQEGLLPVLRRDDGADPARSRYPDTGRRGLPARDDGLDRRIRADPVQQRPCLGRGLLPGLRLGDVRPDERGCRPAGAIAVRAARGERLAAAVRQRRAARIVRAARRGDRRAERVGQPGQSRATSARCSSSAPCC